MNKIEQIKQLVSSLEDDYSKFYDKKISAAGTRLRKGMQELKVLAQEVRIDVQEKKK
jgi:hypothetical protein